MKSILSFFLLCTIFPTGRTQFGGLPSGGKPSKPSGGGAPGTGGLPTGGGGLPTGGGVPTGGGGLPGGLPNASSGVLPLDIGDICQVFKLQPNPLLGAELVSGTCNMAKNWLNNIKDIAKGKPPSFRSILSENQGKYWDLVVGCHSVQCICDYWPKCKNFTDEVASGKRQVNATELLYYSQRYGTVTRKDIRVMSDVERRRFFFALNKLKNDKIDGWSKFDILTGYHFFVPFTPSAHFSAGVLPFHRELMKILETALRFEHPLATFAMWDASLCAEMNNPKDTVIWTEELLGKGDGNVTDGPFGTWVGEANKNFPAPLYQGGIFRAFGLSQKGVLFNNEYIELIMKFPNMQSLVFCTNPFLDTVHAGTHLYVGGLMADPATSPSEPIFYLHHVFLDSVWERWRQKHQTREQRKSEWALPCPYNPFDIPESPLFPFDVKVKDAYSNVYTDEFYTYQEQPSCANNCHDSRFLVCNPKTTRCMSRVRVGGDCSGLSVDPCYKSKCQGGKCVKE